jgi:hypothetical protein
MMMMMMMMMTTIMSGCVPCFIVPLIMDCLVVV